MLSRVADSIYWMSRYLERAENVARFINVNLQLMLDMPGGEREQWEPLVVTSGDQELFKERFGSPTRENVLRFLTFDTGNLNSIYSCLHRARENARSVREIISQEMWEQLNVFYLTIRKAASDPAALASPHDLYTYIKNTHLMFKGVSDATMSHNEGWHFARLGQMIERADKTSRILDVKYFYLLPQPSDVGTPFDNLQWTAVLKSSSALEMYRKRHHVVEPTRVCEFLILDREFPRAIRYCLIKAEESLHSISGSQQGTFHNPAEQRLGRLRAEFDYMHAREIFHTGLHEFLDIFQKRLNTVGDAVFETFFSQAPVGGLEETPADRRRPALQLQ